MIRRAAFLALPVIVPVILAAPAQADPVSNYARTTAFSICDFLDSHTTLTGLSSVFEGVQRDTGFTDRETVQVVILAVDQQCPRHWTLLQRFASTYRSGGSGVAA